MELSRNAVRFTTLHDPAECSNTGTISMIHGRRGNILREWEIPGAEITGIAIR